MVADFGQPLDEHLFINGSAKPKKVAYFYDSDVGNYAYVAGHPMKPHRIRVAHSLIMNYGAFKKMEIYRAKPATKFEMTQFHTDEYVDFLQRVTPDNMDQFGKEQGKYNVGDDCPVFDGLFEFCGISAGGSMEGAARLNRNRCDIAINWAGGLHHAKKSEASGFCYVNDIVLGIIELLRFHQRVLYIDIDVHHGDGVEEAFYTTNRVMTCSFHKYGEYFPGTGELRDIGVGEGKYHAVNFPLRDGITDSSYRSVFEPVVSAIMEYFRPQAVVLQCGGDSLSGDRLGCFNLSMRGHANCVRFVKSFNLPTLVLGGGGYTMRNVARTWAFETGTLLGMNMSPHLPYNDYYEYFAPDYELDVRPSNMDNANTPEYLEKIKNSVIENLRRTANSSVQMQDTPRRALLNGMESDDDDEADDEDVDLNPDVRTTQRQADKRVHRDDEFEDSDDEMDGEASRRKAKRSRVTDFENPHAQPDVDIDADGNEIMISGANGAVVSGTGSRAENQRIADQKAEAALSMSPRSNGSPSPLGGQGSVNGDDKKSREASPDADAADEEDEGDMDEMDVDMEDVDAEDEGDDEQEPADDMDADVEISDGDFQPPTASGQDTPLSTVDQDVVAAAATLASAPTSAPQSAVAATQPTPPESPPAAVAPAPAPQPGVQPTADSASEDVDMAEAGEEEPAVEKEQGLEERQGEDEKAEEKAEDAAASADN